MRPLSASARCPRLPLAMLLLVLLIPTLSAALPRLAPTVADPGHSTPRIVSCRDLEVQCLDQGKLTHEESCYTPLERGPCLENEWLLLSNETVQGLCSPRTCAVEEVHFQGLCLNKADAQARVCQGGALHLGPSGLPRCGPRPAWPLLLAAHVRCSSASLPMPDEPLVEEVLRTSGVQCAVNDKMKCGAEVQGSSPAPVIARED